MFEQGFRNILKDFMYLVEHTHTRAAYRHITVWPSVSKVYEEVAFGFPTV